MLEFSGSHSTLWVCIFSANGECEQKKTVDLVKSGSGEEVNFWPRRLQLISSWSHAYASGRVCFILEGDLLLWPTSNYKEKKNPQYAKWILNTELDLAPLSQSHSEFSFVFTEALLWQDKQTPHTHNRDKDGTRKRDLGAVADNIFTEELQGAKILSTESVVLIVHWLILHLKGPQGFLTELKFATQLHPYYRSGGGACSINSSCSSSGSRSSSGGRGNSSGFS